MTFKQSIRRSVGAVLSRRQGRRVLLAAVALALTACAPNYYHGPPSDHFDGVRFFNPGSERQLPPLAFWRWRLTRERGFWPNWVDNAVADAPPPRVMGDELRVSFINHSTVLLQTQGLNLLTDPIWSERASPLSFAGPKRVRAPGVAFDALPKIDIVLLSHNHYDHMDLPTLTRLWRRDRPRILAPLGNDAILRARDASLTVESLDWGQSLSAAPNVTISLEPMRHWSARTPWDRNRALWGAFVAQAPGGAIYFVGDAGYGDGSVYREAARKYGGFRLALLPIGAYEPRWFMAYAHQTPEEAVRAHFDARACFSLATQHYTFPMADEGYEQPPRELAAARLRHGVSEASFRALENGEHWQTPRLTPTADNRWRCPDGRIIG